MEPQYTIASYLATRPDDGIFSRVIMAHSSYGKGSIEYDLNETAKKLAVIYYGAEPDKELSRESMVMGLTLGLGELPKSRMFDAFFERIVSHPISAFPLKYLIAARIYSRTLNVRRTLAIGRYGYTPDFVVQLSRNLGLAYGKGVPEEEAPKRPVVNLAPEERKEVPKRPVEEVDLAPPAKQSKVSEECCICFEAPLETVFIPCGHRRTCMKCSKGLESCPICRARIAFIQRCY